jgi:prephenate dehydrogenase
MTMSVTEQAAVRPRQDWEYEVRWQPLTGPTAGRPSLAGQSWLVVRSDADDPSLAETTLAALREAGAEVALLRSTRSASTVRLWRRPWRGGWRSGPPRAL